MYKKGSIDGLSVDILPRNDGLSVDILPRNDGLSVDVLPRNAVDLRVNITLTPSYDGAVGTADRGQAHYRSVREGARLGGRVLSCQVRINKSLLFTHEGSYRLPTADSGRLLQQILHAFSFHCYSASLLIFLLPSPCTSVYFTCTSPFPSPV